MASSKKSRPPAPPVRVRNAALAAAPLAAAHSTADHSRRAALAIFLVVAGVAWLVRLIYLAQIRDVVFFDHYVVDARAYDEWASRIAKGDWIGTGVFYQAPLYPYFLAIIKLIIGDSPWWTRFIQFTIGAASCGFLALAGRAWFGRVVNAAHPRFGNSVGLCAGFMLALYPPAIFFDGIIQKSVLDLLFGTLLLWRLALVADRPTWIGWLMVGILSGLLALTRETALLLVVVLLVWVLVHFAAAAPLAKRLGWSATLTLGLAAVLGPVALRNRIVGGEFALTTSQAGPNFFIGNNPDANGTYQPLMEGRSDPRYERADATAIAEQVRGQKLSPGEVSSFWFGEALAFIRAEPGKWFAQLSRKSQITFNATEVPDAEVQCFYEESSGLLRGLSWFWHFGVLLPLAALGLVLTAGHWRRLWLLYAIVVALAAGPIVFYVFGRYRFPMTPVLMLLAAAGIVEAVARLRSGRDRWLLAPAAAALAALAVFANWPLGDPFTRASFLSGTYWNAGSILAEAKEWERALAFKRRAIAIDPRPASMRVGLASSYAELNRIPEALEQLRIAAQEEPANAAVARSYGTLLAQEGQLDAGTAELRRAVALDPQEFPARMNLAQLAQQAGRLAETARLLREALPLAAPGEAPGIALRLAALLATCSDPQVRDGPAAVALLEPLRTQYPNSAEVLDTLAAAYAAAGRFADAQQTGMAALVAAQTAGATELAGEIEKRLALYRANQSYVAP